MCRSKTSCPSQRYHTIPVYPAFRSDDTSSAVCTAMNRRIVSSTSILHGVPNRSLCGLRPIIPFHLAKTSLSSITSSSPPPSSNTFCTFSIANRHSPAVAQATIPTKNPEETIWSISKGKVRCASLCVSASRARALADRGSRATSRRHTMARVPRPKPRSSW
jgi:hypothetical protein